MLLSTGYVSREKNSAVHILQNLNWTWTIESTQIEENFLTLSVLIFSEMYALKIVIDTSGDCKHEKHEHFIFVEITEIKPFLLISFEQLI